MPTTVADVVERALVAMDRLVETAAPIDDEWQYVTDLRTVWGARLRAVGAARGTEPAAEAGVAIEVLSEVVATIADPHRAIDWLSTFPQASLLALGEASS